MKIVPKAQYGRPLVALSDNTRVAKPIIERKILYKLKPGELFFTDKNTGKKILIKPRNETISADRRNTYLKKLNEKRTQQLHRLYEEDKKLEEGMKNLLGFLTFASPSTYIGPIFNSNGKSYAENVMSGEGTGDVAGNVAIDILTPFAVGSTKNLSNSFFAISNKNIRNRLIINAFNKAFKNSDKLDIFKEHPEFGQIGTPFQYSDYIDKIFKNSKLKGIYYHGGPKGIERFKTPKDIDFKINKTVHSGTKDLGIYFTKNKSYANQYKRSNNNGLLYRVKLNALNPYYTNDWFLVRYRSMIDKNYVNPMGITDRVRYNTLKNNDAVVWNGELGESVVFDPSLIHILGSKKDFLMFQDYVNMLEKHPFQ